jgi:hypothetical protein
MDLKRNMELKADLDSTDSEYIPEADLMNRVINLPVP